MFWSFVVEKTIKQSTARL